ncbi:alpha/beta hydrolase [Caulobacter sp. 73W]|uniref:Alpha/beta hydrolase n=1 Tax=Caulobacter sp. 73W TaxID=3161137 RepID=A0AB39KWR9_9CAUL
MLSPPNERPISEATLLERTGQLEPRRHVDLEPGLRLAYADRGQGRTVVLLHGLLTTLEDMMLALGPALDRRRVLAFDRPGLGQSRRRRGLDAGVARQAQHLWAALDKLQVRKPLIVGHSFGATVALAMAMRRPDDTAGVVALAPIVSPEPRLEHAIFAPRGFAFSEFGLVQACRYVSDRLLLPLLWRAMYLPQPMPPAVEETFPFALAGSDRATLFTGEDSFAGIADLYGLLRDAPACRTPIEILTGDQDAVVDYRRHSAMAAEILPKADLHVSPGLGHMLHHFAPERIIIALEALERRSTATPPA